MPSPRRILVEHGLTAHKDRGQNFLVDPQLARHIVALAGFGAGEVILEIGPGLGALTRPILEAGHRVMAVEVDRGLARYLEETLRPRFPGRLNLIVEDVLKVDLSALARTAGGKLTIIGNLPYQISSPLLIKLLDHRGIVRKATLMFQRELADRIVSRSGSRSYGRLSVLMGYFARVERLADLEPEAFQPRPKVVSTVLGVEFKEAPEPPVRSERLFRRVVTAGFSQRRKTLRNALRSALPAVAVEAALAAARIDPGRRAETLTVEEFVALANAWPAGDSKEEFR